MDTQQAQRLRVLWKSGRDKYSAFFSGLEEVRREIGDDALPSWCRTELFIGLSVIVEFTALLNKADMERERVNFSAAKRAEAATKHAERVAHASERHEYELEKAQRSADKIVIAAKAKAEVANIEAAIALQTKRVKKTTARRASDEHRKPKRQAKQALANVLKFQASSTDLNQLAQDILDAYARVESIGAEWVNASVSLAKLLAEARARIPSNKQFGEWLASNGIDRNKDDRARLIWLGAQPNIREILSSTTSHSYQRIGLYDSPLSSREDNGNITVFPSTAARA